MKQTIYNDNNLSIMDIDEIETRCKALMINSNNQILMGYYKETYQFIGGHLREGEKLTDTLRREIKEETGIDYDTTKLKPFYSIKYFNKNNNNSGKNVLSQVFYYLINIDERYHMKDTNYDRAEINGDYSLKYVDLEEFNEVMINSRSNVDPLNGIILRDNIEVMDYYKSMLPKKEKGKGRTA